jgi:hypothetical protein
MKHFASVSFERFMELAVQAGHQNDMPFGDAGHIALSQQLDYIKFALAIAEKLQTTSFDNISMKDIMDAAVKNAGLRVTSPPPLAAFFYRFAHYIANELK